MFLGPHKKGVCLFGAAIQPSSIQCNISAQREHFLFKEISSSGIDSFYLEIEMEGLSFHQLDACGIHSHSFHLLDGFIGIRDVKASNQIHLFCGGSMP
jgi:hypothetical protein